MPLGLYKLNYPFDSQDKVTIVIPMFNHRDYIRDAVDSALAQTYIKKEILVIDDGCTDGSLDVLMDYGFKICVKGYGENRGLAAARNYGIDHAEGEFILPLDSDDKLEPTFLEKTVPLMRDPKVGIVSTGMQYFGIRNTRIRPPVKIENKLAQQLHYNDIPVCSLLRRSALEQVGGYKDIHVRAGDRKIIGYEDWELWINMLKHGWQIDIVHEILFLYRTKEQSMITLTHGHEEGLKAKIRNHHKELYE